MNKEVKFLKTTNYSLVVIAVLLHGCAPNVDLKESSRAVKEIRDPTEQMQLISVQRYQKNHPPGTLRPRTLPYEHPICKMPDAKESAQLLAIKYQSLLINCIENPTEKIQLYIIENAPSLINMIKNIENVSIKNHPKFIAYKKEQRASGLKRKKEEKEAEAEKRRAELKRKKELIEENKRRRKSSYSSSGNNSTSSTSSSSNYSPPQKTCRNVQKVRTVGVRGGKRGQTTQEHYYEEECSY